MKSEPEWLETAQNVILEAIPDAQDCSEPAADTPASDLHIRCKAALLRVEVKVIRAPRISEVEGQLASFALKRSHQKRSPKDIDVIVVALSKFGPRLEGAVRDYMEQYAPDVGWGLLDLNDKAVLVVPGLQVEWKRAPSLPERRPSLFERRDRKLFTDLNRWMLKVLILRFAPEDQWGGPRKWPQHATDLAHIAGVSVSKAHQFASAFQQEGYLRKSAQGLRMVRLPALLDAWLQDEKNSSPKMSPARSLLPAQAPPPETPVLPEPWDDSAFGGLFAAKQMGLLHVSGHHVPLLHVGKPMTRAMHEWQLESCDVRDAQLILAEPLYPRSVFRGVIKQEQSAPRVDLWQAALDSVSSAARGQEQAKFIVERILALQESS